MWAGLYRDFIIWTIKLFITTILYKQCHFFGTPLLRQFANPTVRVSDILLPFGAIPILLWRQSACLTNRCSDKIFFFRQRTPPTTHYPTMWCWPKFSDILILTQFSDSLILSQLSRCRRIGSTSRCRRGDLSEKWFCRNNDLSNKWIVGGGGYCTKRMQHVGHANCRMEVLSEKWVDPSRFVLVYTCF